MRTRKIYIVGGDYGYANWCEADVVSTMEEADIVMFTGGSDVTPVLYDKTPHPQTEFNWRRDKEEVAEFEKAKRLGLPMIGICRGSQFLCVMAGGILVQHQSHPYLHKVNTNDGRQIVVTSTHHQRQYIKGIEDKVDLIAWSEHLSPFNYGEDNNDILSGEQEVEIAYYKNIRALGIQSHPEFVYPCKDEWQVEYIEYCRELMATYLDK